MSSMWCWSWKGEAVKEDREQLIGNEETDVEVLVVVVVVELEEEENRGREKIDRGDARC